MFKKIMNLAGVSVALYYAMNWVYNAGLHEFYEKLKKKAIEHPEMTLAEVMFKEIEV